MHQDEPRAGTSGDLGESRIISQAGHVVDERGAFSEGNLCHGGLRRIDGDRDA